MAGIIYSFDVEEELHGGGYARLEESVARIESICDKSGIKPVLFVTGGCIKKNASLFKRLLKKGWEISFHGMSHKRFDDMTFSGKEKEIKEGIAIFKRCLGIKPKGFRAPQHSIDEETLDLLEKHGFEYDSSFTPLNLLQLFFFPKRWKTWLKGFFSPLNPYKIRKNLYELPPSSLVIPFVSLAIRVLPMFMLKPYVWLAKKCFKKPVFYAHSWDFIKMKESRIDSFFGHEIFISKLDRIMRTM